tara:strand:- start:1495 stop:2016 length:522 start_codon:yes stop_codon:yes gene_type:complete
MNFRGHMMSGGVVGIGVVVGAVKSQYIAANDYLTFITLWITTLFFSLFPDLDAASVPQRWFFRLVFLILLVLGWYERYDMATLIALLALLPLLDHHRGWTHWKISPLLVGPILAVVFNYWNFRSDLNGTFSWESVWQSIREHEVYLIACLLGWYTHLLLDGHFRLFPTDRNHH